MVHPGTLESIRVASDSPAPRVAGAIAHVWRSGQRPVVLRAIGAGAVNRALKAVSIASEYLGLNLACLPKFVVVQENGQERTVTLLFVVAVDDGTQGQH